MHTRSQGRISNTMPQLVDMNEPRLKPKRQPNQRQPKKPLAAPSVKKKEAYEDESPWRSTQKIEALAEQNKWSSEKIGEQMLLKQEPAWNEKEQRKFFLNIVAEPNTYNIDYFFDTRKSCYFLAINMNTRKAYGWPSKSRDADHSLANLEMLISHVGVVKGLVHDQEKAFLSDVFLSTCKLHKIKQYPYQKYEVNGVRRTRHTPLSMIDRLSRTLRDMWYVANRNQVVPLKPEAFNWLIEQYNKSPHTKLSKFFKRPVSPNDMTLAMEQQLIKALMQENIDKFRPVTPGAQYKLRWMKETPFEKRRHAFHNGSYTAIGNYGNSVELQGPDNKKLLVSRWMITPTDVFTPSK